MIWVANGEMDSVGDISDNGIGISGDAYGHAAAAWRSSEGGTIE